MTEQEGRQQQWDGCEDYWCWHMHGDDYCNEDGSNHTAHGCGADIEWDCFATATDEYYCLHHVEAAHGETAHGEDKPPHRHGPRTAAAYDKGHELMRKLGIKPHPTKCRPRPTENAG